MTNLSQTTTTSKKGKEEEEEWLETWSKNWFNWVLSDSTIVIRFFMVS